MQKVPKEWIERAARVYNSNSEASKALCRQYGIETPFARQRNARQAARSRA